MARFPMVAALVLGGCSAAPVAPPQQPPPVDVPPAVATEPPPDEPEPPAETEELEVSDTGLGIVELVRGQGPEAVSGAEVTVHYVGKLEDGSIFDSSRQRDRPFTFTLGAGMVIDGWEQGIAGMRVGGRRRLLVPPSLAYGERGLGSVPPGAILEFEIELLAVEPPP